MQEFFAEASGSASQSLIRPPLAVDAPSDPVLAWREQFQAVVRPEAPHLLRAIGFDALYDQMEDLFPLDGDFLPGFRQYDNAIWSCGSGALYDGDTGMALPGSILTRFPRHRQTPHCHSYRIELTSSPDSLSGLERAVYLPFAVCENFGHFVTETMSFLWPFLVGNPIDPSLVGWPVMLTHCRPDDPMAPLLQGLVNGCQCFPLFDDQLPKALRLDQVLIPESSFSLHASCSPVYPRTAFAFGDWLLDSESPRSPVVPVVGKVFISRSGLQRDVRCVDREPDLEAILQDNGWMVFRPEQHVLADQIAVYRSARVIAGFEGSALHCLATLGENPAGTSLIMLGDAYTSPDYLLQFRAQKLQGFFVQCTDLDPATEHDPMHLRRRLLNVTPESLASMIEALAAAC